MRDAAGTNQSGNGRRGREELHRRAADRRDGGTRQSSACRNGQFSGRRRGPEAGRKAGQRAVSGAALRTLRTGLVAARDGGHRGYSGRGADAVSGADRNEHVSRGRAQVRLPQRACGQQHSDQGGHARSLRAMRYEGIRVHLSRCGSGDQPGLHVEKAA